jgi:hypothetical protein
MGNPLSATIGYFLALSALSSWDLLPSSTTVQAALFLAGASLTMSMDSGQWQRSSRFGRLVSLLGVALSVWLLLVSAFAFAEGTLNPSCLVVTVLAALPLTQVVVRRRSQLDLTLPASRMKFMYAGATLWAVAAIVDAVGAPSGLPLQFMSHERTFIAILVLTIRGRAWFGVVRLMVLAAVTISIVKYPSATSIIALSSGAGVLLIQRIERPARRMTTAGISLGVIALAAVNSSVLQKFYLATGRNDNSSTREYLWAQAQSIISASPLVGGHASLPVTAVFTQYGKNFVVPLHNTWLTVGVVGGVVAILLLFAISGAAVFAGLMGTRRTTPWLAPLAASLVTLTVNPTLDRPDTAALFWVLVLTAAASEKPRRQ